MRRKDKEITDVQHIHAIIKNAEFCHLSMCNDNIPYCVAMNYGVDPVNPSVLYLHGASLGQKFDFIHSNPRVCITIETKCELIRDDDVCEWGMRYESVILQGSAEILSDDAEKTHGLRCIVGHFTEKLPESFPEQMLSRTAVIKATITEMTGKKA